MVAFKPAEVDRFVARPDPARAILLVFGPDAGLVRERAEALVSSAVDDPRDPFQLARLDGDELAADPTRLVEEATTIPPFGGRRAVWVRAGSRNLAPALEALMASAAADCRVVIEAGDLKRNAPLRSICERAANAAALPCYPDTETELARVIDEEMRQANLSITTEARAALIPLLGGNRQTSRQELRKLALLARGKVSVELDDVLAVVADASSLTLDGLIDAAFAGRTGELEVLLVRAETAGTSPGTLLSAAQRQVAQLHKARLVVENGGAVSEVFARMFLHFSRRNAVEAALRNWTSSRLERAMTQLADAVLESRRQSAMADVIARRALLVLAVNARRKEQ
jgi:DNA polymerase-3 subunit delta